MSEPEFSSVAPAERAQLHIWDLDLLAARSALREWLGGQAVYTPYHRVAKRRLGRFVVAFVPPMPSSGDDAGVLWIHCGVDDLGHVLGEARNKSARNGDSAMDVQYQVLPAVIGLLQRAEASD